MEASMLMAPNLAREVPREAVLGRGSYATIWRAKDRHTGKLFAVKTFNLSGVMRIPMQECQVSVKIVEHSHPFVVKLHQVFRNPCMSAYSVLMESCSGGDLRDSICAAWNAAKQMNAPYQMPPQAMTWAAEVFLGLEHLHLKCEILHLDVKPDNVMVDDKGHAKLIDFGFSHLGTQSSGEFPCGVPPGSPEYVAPEVLLKEAYSYSADFYSYGVMLWVLLTGGTRGRHRNCVPPCAEWRPPNTEPLLSNWQRLEEVVKDPASAGAAAMSEDAQNLILKLTQRGAGWTSCSHEDIRMHQLLTDSIL
jgi:serine/threonine protein kinase